MLSVPFTILISFIYEPYERQYVFTLWSQLAMFGANVVMFYQMTSVNSSYRKTSMDDVGLPH